MNIPLRYPTLSLAVLGVILASPLRAASASTPPMMYHVNQVWSGDGLNIIKLGAHENSIRFRYGRPAYQPAENVWILHGFTGNLEEAKALNCRNLLVTFKDHRVASIKLINDKAVNVIRARTENAPTMALPDTVYLSKN